MIRLTALLAIVFALPAMAAEDCQLKRLIQTRADYVPGQGIVIDAALDNTPVHLEIDTGAAISAIFESAVSRFGLPKISTRAAGGIDGDRLIYRTKVPALAIGGAVSHSADFTVAPVSAGDPALVGLFGSDYLSNYDVEIDLPDHLINFFSQDHCPGKVVYWSTGYNVTPFHSNRFGAIRTPVQLNGQTITAMIDTGASDTILNMGRVRQLFDLTPDSAGMISAGHVVGIGGGLLPAYKYPFKTLTLGDLTVHNPLVLIAQFQRPRTEPGSYSLFDDIPDMMVGMNVLSHLRLYIAYGEHNLYYTVVTPKTVSGSNNQSPAQRG